MTADQLRDRLGLAADEGRRVFRAVNKYVGTHCNLRPQQAAPISHEAIQFVVTRMLERLLIWECPPAREPPFEPPFEPLDPNVFSSEAHADNYIVRGGINWVKDNCRDSHVPLGELEPAAPPHVEEWTAPHLRHIPHALATLNPVDRLLVRLRYYERWTFEELATIHCPNTANPNTAVTRVRSHIIRLTKRMKPYFDEDNDDEDNFDCPDAT